MSDKGYRPAPGPTASILPPGQFMWPVAQNSAASLSTTMFQGQPQIGSTLELAMGIGAAT